MITKDDRLPALLHRDAVELAHRWWALALRGVVALLFGVVCFAIPSIGFAALVALLAAYFLVHGVLDLILGIRVGRAGGRWGWLIFEGIVSILAAGVALFLPALTGLILVIWVGAWALVTGISEIATAIRLRKALDGEWVMVLMGVLSIGLGVGIMMFPATGALVLVFWIGAYALVMGGLMLYLAFRLRSWGREQHRMEPTGGLPTPA